MNKDDTQLLESLSLRVREHIIRMSGKGGCFIGASLSCTDIIAYLYRHFLRIRPETVDDPDRDTMLLSKGHDVPALYGVLAELGYLETERLNNHMSINDRIYWHPNTSIPAVEFHSGSLGHLPAVAVGIALDAKRHRQVDRLAAAFEENYADSELLPIVRTSHVQSQLANGQYSAAVKKLERLLATMLRIESSVLAYSQMSSVRLGAPSIGLPLPSGP